MDRAGIKDAPELLEATLLRTESCFLQDPANTAADLLLRGLWSFRRSRRTEQAAGLFRLRYVMDLRPGRFRLLGPVIRPADGFGRDRITEQREAVTDAWLLPVLTPGDYPILARELLRELRFEPYEWEQPVKGKVLAAKLGLKLRFAQLPAGSARQGLLLFEEGPMRLRDENGGETTEILPAGTILINRDLVRDDRELNAVLAHECAHFALHRNFLMLQRGAGYSWPPRTDPRGVAAGMEQQAEALAAALLRRPGGDVPFSPVTALFLDPEEVPLMAARMAEVRNAYLPPELRAPGGTFAREKENRQFIDDARLWAALGDSIPAGATAEDAVNIIRERKGLSMDALALRIGVDRKTLTGWLRAGPMSLQHAVALCVALQLRADLAGRLVRLAECPVRHVPGWEVYWMMLEYAPYLTVERCQEIARQAGIEPLHRGGTGE